MAGGGPENVALVVNQDSWASLTIANKYIRLRQIPACNVIYLSSPALARSHISVDEFRNEILIPVMGEIRRRGLETQIDYVVYSADFPYSINVRSDRGEAVPYWMKGNASINGLTYLYQAVLEKNWQNYLSLDANLYAKSNGQGFRGSYGWTSSGLPTNLPGRRYILSTMLAVTSGRGNTVEEVHKYLSLAASADSTHPPGTIYLMENNNIRSDVREWAFTSTVRDLERIGVEGRIETGRIPFGRLDVMGAVVGTATFDWKRSGSKMLPGAICEHLTSRGGDLRSSAGQTPLSEFLRNGAAGSSGTVSEPYAIQAKFPTARLHVAYAQGCSLAESFYQSVAGPFQLLIVGDPLCQPWADRPTVFVDGIEKDAVVSGNVMIGVSAASPHGIRHLEIFVDGKRRAIYRPGSSFPLDTRSLWNGPHELRVVAVAGDAVETQGRVVVPFTVDNSMGGTYRPASVQKAGTRNGPQEKNLIRGRVRQQVVQYGEAIQVDSAVHEADWIGVFQGTRLVGRIPGNAGTATVHTNKLGAGDATLRLVAHLKDQPVVEQQVGVNVELPTYSPLKIDPNLARLQPGFLLKTEQNTQVVESAEKIVGKLNNQSPFIIAAKFKAESAETYQLQLQPTTDVSQIKLNGQEIPFNQKANRAVCPIRLDEGWYDLRIVGKISNNALPNIRFEKGNTTVQWLWYPETTE